MTAVGYRDGESDRLIRNGMPASGEPLNPSPSQAADRASGGEPAAPDDVLRASSGAAIPGGER